MLEWLIPLKKAGKMDEIRLILVPSTLIRAKYLFGGSGAMRFDR